MLLSLHSGNNHAFLKTEEFKSSLQIARNTSVTPFVTNSHPFYSKRRLREYV